MDLKKLLSEEGLTDQDPWLEGLRAVNPLDGTSKNVENKSILVMNLNSFFNFLSPEFSKRKNNIFLTGHR